MLTDRVAEIGPYSAERHLGPGFFFDCLHWLHEAFYGRVPLLAPWMTDHAGDEQRGPPLFLEQGVVPTEL